MIKKYYTKIKQVIVPDISISSGTAVLLVVISFLFGLTIWLLNRIPSLQHIWETFTFDKRIPASFCENIHLGNPVRQPVNTFSNIVYLITAIVILRTRWEERYKSNPRYLNTVHSFLFGVILLYVFGASTFYHASLINVAHKLDYSAVFAFSLFPVMFFVHRWWLSRNSNIPNAKNNISTALFLSSFLAVNLLLSFLLPKGKESIAVLIIILLFLGLAFVTIKTEPDNPGRHYLILSILSILIALLWFEFDKNKILCKPNSYFQPHSLWNLFVGLSAFNFYLHIQNENESGARVIKMNQE